MTTRVAGSPNVLMAMRGAGDISYKPMRESLAVTLRSAEEPQLKGTMHEIVTRTKIFLNWPLLSAQVPGHTPWIEEDMSAIGSTMGMNFGGMRGQGSAGNPSQMLSYLKGVSTLKPVGPATIGGVATTEYSGLLDYSKLVTKGVLSEKGLDTLRTEMGRTTVPFTLWLDRSDMVRQMEMNIKATAANGPTVLMHVEFGFSRFGEKVHIKVPPTNQVYDATQLLTPGSTS
jgi:hypothetical protein